MYIDTGGREPAVCASIKVSILYNIFAQNPRNQINRDFTLTPK